MKALILVATISAACAATDKREEPLDDDAGYVRHIRNELDQRKEIYDSESRLVRKICAHRRDIADCAVVLPRLPEPLRLP